MAREIVFADSGSFSYWEADGGSSTKTVSETFETDGDSLTLHLEEGEFRWGESTNIAPISFTFTYELNEPTLELTFEVMGQVTTVIFTRLA